MKKQLLILGLSSILATGTSLALADKADCEHGLHGKLQHRIAKQLDLNDQQKSAIKKIRHEQRENRKETQAEIKQLMTEFKTLNPDAQNYEQTVEQLAERKAALVATVSSDRLRSKAAIRALLTPEQREKADHIRNKIKKHRKAHFLDEFDA